MHGTHVRLNPHPQTRMKSFLTTPRSERAPWRHADPLRVRKCGDATTLAMGESLIIADRAGCSRAASPPLVLWSIISFATQSSVGNSASRCSLICDHGSDLCVETLHGVHLGEYNRARSPVTFRKCVICSRCRGTRRSHPYRKSTGKPITRCCIAVADSRPEPLNTS